VSYKDIIDSSTGKVVSGEEAAKMKGLEKKLMKAFMQFLVKWIRSTRELLAKLTELGQTY
jgi:hypothetical protein